MHVNVDLRDKVHVARQPVFDRFNRVFGYELLYWDNLAASAHLVSSDVAVTRVLTDSLLTLGLDAVTGGLPAFIGFTRRVLLDCTGRLVPPPSTIIALGGDVDVDDEVVGAARALQRQGCTFALDGFRIGSEAERLLPFAKYLMVDIRSTTPPERERISRELLPRGLVLVAKHVDTALAAQQARSAGYTLVQGFFFYQPTVLTGRGVPSTRVSHLQLLAAFNKPHLRVDDLDDLIKRDASMSYRILRCVNSAAFATREPVRSIRHAILLLGFDQIRQWASAWALAGANQDGPAELAVMAILRARCCELLGAAIEGPDASGEFFLLGLCSLLDAILGQPLEQALTRLPLDDHLRSALLGGTGIQRSVLDAITAYERGDWTAAAAATRAAGGDPASLPEIYNSGLQWARALSRATVAA